MTAILQRAVGRLQGATPSATVGFLLYSLSHAMLRQLLTLFLCLSSGAISAQRALTTPDFTGFSERDGLGVPNIVKLVPLSDGSALVLGRFEAWYDGVRFRDVMRLRPGGLPDSSWRVNATFRRYPALESVRFAVETPYGIAISGYFDTVNEAPQASAAYLSKDSGQLLSRPQFSLPKDGSIWAPLTDYDATSDLIYSVTSQPQRFSAKTGALDATWSLFFANSQYVRSGPVDSSGGIWATESYEFPGYTVKRYSVADLGRPARPTTTIPDSSPAVLGGGYAYVGSARWRTDNVSTDSSWKAVGAAVYVTPQYAYYTYVSPADYLSAGRLTRAPVTGTGSADSWGYPYPVGSLGSSGELKLIAWPTAGDAGNLGLLTRKVVAAGANPMPVLLVNEDLVGNADPSVVEYYATTLKRYFITGRKAEQDLLDALPASFVRTGMRFNAKSSRYRDIPEQPVCRLYAAPDKGGSNSHFYGIGDDCPTLNKLPGLKYEGFDFSVIKATGAGCSADAPNIVTRLFNNKIATNEGNHRYVVSTVTKAKMLAQGWVDEGAVFCSVSVTDANLAN